MRIRPADALLAIGMAAVACFGVSSENARSVPIALAAAAVASLTLALYRQWPWLPAVALLVTNAGLSATTPGDYPPDTVALPMMLAIFLLARATHAGQAWLAGAVTLALTVVGHVLTPDGEWADFWPLVIWGVPWAAGRAIQRVTVVAARQVSDAERDQERAASEAATAERDRIARELHDVVAHSVSMMVMRAGGQRLRVAGSDAEAAAAFGDIERTGREALTELRAMLGVLRDPGSVETGHEPLPGRSGIGELVERMRDAGQPVELLAFDLPADLPAGVSLAAYRIVQEALTNALRYGSGPVELAIGSNEESVHIRATNPIGDRVGGHGAGHGLVGMRERTRLLGGTVEAGDAGGRWTLEATLPLATAGRT